MTSDFEHLAEETLLAMLGWGEARGEGALGMLAVMWVAKNRSDKRMKALKDVILQPFQFSCFNPLDPNHSQLFEAEKEPDTWGFAKGAANLVLRGYTIDPTRNATHYYSLAIPPPIWARPDKGWVELTKIGHHVFGVAR